MAVYCTCSGDFGLKISRSTFLSSLNTLKKIASYHEFVLLEEEVDWMLSMNA